MGLDPGRLRHRQVRVDVGEQVKRMLLMLLPQFDDGEFASLERQPPFVGDGEGIPVGLLTLMGGGLDSLGFGGSGCCGCTDS
jgi:hypothetical protein